MIGWAVPENVIKVKFCHSFVFFEKGGEVATNRLVDQELSVLALHLLQIYLVYINTLIIQQVLAEPPWLSRMEL